MHQLQNSALPRVPIDTPAVQSRFVVYYDFNYFSQEEWTDSSLEFQIQAKNTPAVLPSSPIKSLGKTVMVFMSYDRTLKQADKTTYNFTYHMYKVTNRPENIAFTYTGCPTSYQTKNGSKLPFSGLIRKFHQNESF